jgi:type VI secretion system secreted protein VgrG
MATETLFTALAIGELPIDHVMAFREEQRLGRPPEITITAQLPIAPEIEGLVGQPGTFAFGRTPEATRIFTGIVASVAVVASSAAGGTGIHEYEVTLVTPLSLLDHHVGCRIFQEMDVKEIVSKIFEETGLAMEWRLSGSYPKRVYCVQYDESLLDFVSRLLEEEGIYYFVDMTADGMTVVLADDSTGSAPLDGEATLPFRPAGGMGSHEDHVRKIAEQHRMRSGKFVLRDYDFTRPELDQTVTAEADLDGDLERYDYPGGYVEPSEGQRLAQVRLEAEQVERRLLLVEGDCPRLVLGRKVTIEDALFEAAEGEYVVVAVTHELLSARSAEQMKALSGHEKAAAREDAYGFRAALIPVDVKYRSPQVTPKPLIEGPQTATVVAPAGAQSEEIHTDEWGRSKVKFHWDPSPEVADKASCWIRTKQLQTSGSMVLPRVSWEVAVEFFEGNPDRPYVAGMLYNGAFMPPYALPEGKSRTSMMSRTTPGGGGFNEVRFEDKAGGEEIFIHAQYDMVVHAANNKSKSIGNQEARAIAVNSTTSIGANATTQVTMGALSNVGANHTVEVGGNRKVEVNALSCLKVGGSSTIQVGGKHFEMDGDPLTALVNIAVEKATEYLQEKAAEQLEKLDEYAQGKIDQVMKPIEEMQGKVNKVADAMDKVSQGHLGEVSGALRNAAALPQVDQLGGQMREAAFGGVQQAGSAMGVEVNAPAADASGVSAQTGLDQLVSGAIEKGVRRGGDVADDALHSLFGEALGLDGGGGGGSSLANEAGPELDLAGIDETDREKGPGHSLAEIAGNLTEEVSGAKILAAITGISTEVAGSMTQTIGIGRLEGVLGDRTETVEGGKDEKTVGLVVINLADQSEKVSGSKTTMVGGAVVDLVDGKHSYEAKGPATFIAALHKVEAKGKITFKVGGSEVVVEGGGITFKAPIISVLSPKIQLTKKVAEN